MNIKVHYVNHVGWGKDKDQTFDLGKTEYKHVNATLEAMFGLFNNVIENPKEGELGYYSQKFGIRSMSTGDMVEIDGDTYVCCGMGWTKIKDVDSYRKWFTDESRYSVYEEDLKEFV
jgi:hypothetical protein